MKPESIASNKHHLTGHTLKAEFVRRVVPRLIDPPLLPYPYKCRFDERAVKYGAQVRDFLADNPEYICIVQITHFGLVDPILTSTYYERYIDPNHEREVYGFVSEWHTRNNPYFIRVLKPLAEMADYHLIPIIQTRMKTPEGMEEYGYTRDDIKKDARNVLQELREMRLRADSGIPITFQSAPQGTRSRTGIMGTCDEATEGVIKRLSPGIVVPVSLVYPHWSSHKSPNFGTVLVGAAEPIISTRENPIAFDDLMMGLAQAIPDEYAHLRGAWQKKQ